MRQKFFLQLSVTLASIIPIGAGWAGILYGSAMLGDAGNINMDSHFRYLSGLLFAIGLAFLTTVPKIETHKERFRILTLIVVTGGVARLFAVSSNGWPGIWMQFALAMELIVCPLLCLWQHKFANKD